MNFVYLRDFEFFNYLSKYGRSSEKTDERQPGGKMGRSDSRGIYDVLRVYVRGRDVTSQVND